MQSKKTLLVLVSVAGVIATGSFWAWSRAGTSTNDATPVSNAEPVTDPESGLSSNERQYLWEIENRAFQITYKVGPTFSAALGANDRTTLVDFFHPEFTGTVLDPESAEVFDRGFATFRYSRAADHVTRPVTSDPFIDWLLDELHLFAATPRVQL